MFARQNRPIGGGILEASRKVVLSEGKLTNTGVLILQNDKGLFLSQDLARANYQAELAEILHGTLLGDTTWVNRGVF